MNLADEAGLRNFKDFLLVYNQMSEICFNRCIVNLNSRNLSEEEAACSDVCVSKQMKFNQKAMGVYMVEQPKMLEKKMETAQKESEAMMKQMQEQGVDTTGMFQNGPLGDSGLVQDSGPVANGLVKDSESVGNGIVKDTPEQRTESAATVSEETK